MTPINKLEDVIAWHQKRLKDNPSEALAFLKRAGLGDVLMSERDKMKYDIQAVKEFMGQVGEFGYSSPGKFHLDGDFTLEQLQRIVDLMERYKNL